MKAKLAGWARRYQAALQKHVKQPAGGGFKAALGLGRRAAALDMEMLDVARIHQESMVALELAHSKDGFLKRGETFFIETINPIEKTHRAARDAHNHLSKLNQTLGRRTKELAASNRHLKLGIIRRKAAEIALLKSAEHHTKLLKESRQLQDHLRKLTRRILSAQEDKRKRISRELHDEIAQTLLGINVRLLVLKRAAAVSTGGFQKEIASTQRLVGKSVGIMKRFGR